jgi:DNA polymerase
MHTDLFLDFETFSEVDIEEKGGMAYALDDSTIPICMSWGFEEGPISLWTPDQGIPPEVFDHVTSGRAIYAHNATFDYRIWNYICVRDFDWPEWTLDQTVDTMALCQCYGLPGALDKAGQALNVDFPKMAGKALIKRCCQPQPIKRGKKIIGYRHPHPTDARDAVQFQQLYKYAKRDTQSMREIVSKLPRRRLIPIEHEIWKMTFMMNEVGLPCDPAEVKAIVERINEFLETESSRLHTITKYFLSSPYQYAKIKTFCAKNGFPIDNCQGDYLNDLLDDPDLEIPDIVREVLTLQQTLGKTSTAKFKAFNNLMVPSPNGDPDDYRVHDTFCYHGAGPGRWAGRGVQPQNFPRAKSKDPEGSIAKFINREPIEDPIDAAKKLVRSIVKAPKGYKIIVSDYSSIENRILAWIAGDQKTLDRFAAGHDQYIDMASARYHVPYEEIAKGYISNIQAYKDMRQMGKVIILGCGYGMGWETFKKTAWKQFRLYMTEAEAKMAVNTYRDVYYLVPECWKGLQLAAIRAIKTGKRQTYGLITFGTAVVNRIRWLAMRLPSGKAIYYNSPGVEYRPIPKFENSGPVATVVNYGVNPYSKKWGKLALIPGRITENAVQGTAREVMAHGMLNVKNRTSHIQLIGTVHDEALGLIPEKRATSLALEEFNKNLCDIPWAKDCPIKAEGFIDSRYKKV